jgi:ElaB/YqjD/DUF883 family membrane-anchored ribosome-binding protein
MDYNWQEHWNWLRFEYRRLEEEMRAINATLNSREASGWDRADALIRAANNLCHILRECDKRGLYDAIASGIEDQHNAYREKVLAELSQILREEESLLYEAGMTSDETKSIIHEIGDLLKDQRDQGPIELHAWKTRLSKSTDEICNFPKHELLLRAKDFGGWVKKVDKRWSIVKAIVVGAANSFIATQLPEPKTITTLSKVLSIVVSWILGKEEDRDSV